MTNAKHISHPLVGWFFLTRGKDNEVKWQGRIAEYIDSGGYFRVEFFSWLSGGVQFYRVVTIEEIREHFYLTGRTTEEHDCAGEVIDKLYDTRFVPGGP